MTKALKLRAETQSGLTVISSALQDAILRVGEISYTSKSRALTLRATRYKHESDTAGERVLCGLRLDGVLGLKSRGLDRSDPDAMAVLLAIEFEAGETAPEGKVSFVLAGGGEILAHVECIDMILSDVADPRKTDKRPLHPVDDT